MPVMSRFGQGPPADRAILWIGPAEYHNAGAVQRRGQMTGASVSRHQHLRITHKPRDFTECRASGEIEVSAIEVLANIRADENDRESELALNFIGQIEQVLIWPLPLG